MSAQLELQLVGNQRWRERRDTYRPAGEPIDTSAYEVVASQSDSETRAFIVAHHYSGTLPAARFRYHLHRHGVLVGAAVFSHPTNDLTLTNVFGGKATESVELGRFVLLDDVPGNGETWFLGRCFELLKPEGLRGVLSFSDPLPRRAASGQLITPGHVGTIYQAFNGLYLGRGAARRMRLLKNGQVLSPRALSKIRSKERGWEYAVGQLVAAGAPEPVSGKQHRLQNWLKKWLPRVSVSVPHHGNHRYAWTFDRSRELRQRVHASKHQDNDAAMAWWDQQVTEWRVQQFRESLPDHLKQRPKVHDPEPSITRRAS